MADGFKNTTKTQYFAGGGRVEAKGAAKVSKVMGEFKSGTLHSGSKAGPKVTSPKQAKAIAMSEARDQKAGRPVKKGLGGILKAISPVAAIASGEPEKLFGGMGLIPMLLKKQKSGAPLTPQEKSQLAQSGQAAAPAAPAPAAAPAYKKGGQVSAADRAAVGRGARIQGLEAREEAKLMSRPRDPRKPIIDNRVPMPVGMGSGVTARAKGGLAAMPKG